MPRNRPLFTCQRCGFSNTLIPICLWCAWTSEPAKTDFERSTPRVTRRASTPTQVFWRESTTKQSRASSPLTFHHASITGARNVAGVNLSISMHELETKRVADDSRNPTSRPHQDHSLGGSHADNINLGQGTQSTDGHTDQVATATTYVRTFHAVQVVSTDVFNTTQLYFSVRPFPYPTSRPNLGRGPQWALATLLESRTQEHDPVTDVKSHPLS